MTKNFFRVAMDQIASIMDASPHMVCITERDTMRYVYVNQSACRLTGYTREELLKMGPADVLCIDPKDLERTLDEVILAGAEGTLREHDTIAKDGTRTALKVRRRALRQKDRWVVLSVAELLGEPA